MRLELYGEKHTETSASAKSTHSANPSSERTSRIAKSMGISGFLPTAQARDWKGVTGPNRHSPSISDVLTWLQEGFHANLSVWQDGDEARQMTATSGRKCLESYNASSRHGSSVKTLVALLLGTKAWYSSRCALIWKAKATKSSRLLFQLAPSMRRTGGIESGLLHTSRSVMIEETPENFRKRMNSKRKNDRKSGLPNLAMQISSMLPTPTVNEVEHPNMRLTHDNRRAPVKGKTSHSIGLMDKVAMTGIPTGKKLRLQPAMVEWMMGFPKGWCDFHLEEVQSDMPGGAKKRSNPTETP